MCILEQTVGPFQTRKDRFHEVQEGGRTCTDILHVGISELRQPGLVDFVRNRSFGASKRSPGLPVVLEAIPDALSNQSEKREGERRLGVADAIESTALDETPSTALGPPTAPSPREDYLRASYPTRRLRPDFARVVERE